MEFKDWYQVAVTFLVVGLIPGIKFAFAIHNRLSALETREESTMRDRMTLGAAIERLTSEFVAMRVELASVMAEVKSWRSD